MTSSSHRHETLRFPEGFLWGTSTSAHQVEGNNVLNDWWAWETRGHKRPKSGDACDHYNRFELDFDYIVAMRNNAHRLSLEWSRIQPQPNAWDSSEIRHYRLVLQALRHRRIKTFVTLHHFTNPLWFAKRGGWARSDAPQVFAKYVNYVASQLGDLVDYWITINEPMIYASKGYFEGNWPPGKHSPLKLIKVIGNMESAHNRAYGILHNNRPSTKVGPAVNMFSYQLYRPHNFWDVQFMNRLDGFWNHRFLRQTSGKFDFIGLNYYFHYRLRKFNFNFKQFFVDPRQESREVSDIGWEVNPTGLTQVLFELKNYNKPIYITENGIATDNDDRRVRYLISYLKELYGAIASGIDVRGYFYWSLLDNFEWDKGFDPRFGLVFIDFLNQTRQLKPSGKIYGEIANANAIEHRLLKYLGHGIKVKI